MTMSQAKDKDQPMNSPSLNLKEKQSSEMESESLVDAINRAADSPQQVSEPIYRQLMAGELIIIKEIDKCFINWHEPWRQSFLDGGTKFEVVYELMEGLIHYEDQIRSSSKELPSERLNLIAKAVARLIDYGNAILEIDMAIRTNDESFRELDPVSMTTVELFRAHIQAYKLRRKLLDNYFKKKTQQENSENDILSASSSPPTSTLRIPHSISCNFPPSPTMDRSQRFSIGSNSSINTLGLLQTALSDGRRTPQPLNMSYIEVKTMSSTEDLTESQLEMKHMIATIRSRSFTDVKNTNTRRTLLLGALAKIDSLLTMPATTEKLTNCFELMDTLLDTIERLPADCRKDEVRLMASSVLKTLVRKVNIVDRDYYVEFQHSHWTTYLLSIIRMMSASDYEAYLRTFSNTPDLSAFLKDYLFIIKRLFSSRTKDDDGAIGMGFESEPIYPDCWIEMNLLVCSTFLKSLMSLYQILRQYFASNTQMWLSYLDCLLHLILQDVLQQDRPMLKERQRLMADDLRRTSADYARITWDSLNPDQKYGIIDDIIEPMLMACMKLGTRHRSILLPIFYDMMQCDYEDQYLSRGGTMCSVNEQSFLDQLDSESYISFDDKHGTRHTSDGLRDGLYLSPPKMRHDNSDESLPYLSFLDNQNSSANQTVSDDGTVLTKFTHLIIDKLYTSMITQDLGDEQFKTELCAIIANGESNSKNRGLNQRSPLTRSNDLNQFKSMARHTSELVGEFIQICLDMREANRMSYSHLRLLCLFKLVLFFRDKVDKIDLYLTNLNKLWRIHHSAGRHVEAGFTLLEHAKSLPWTNKPLENHYRIITRSFQTPVTDYISLKLSLYTTIIEYFDQGQLWEAAVPLCRELIDVYQFRLFDYERLSQILARLSQFFSDISSGQKRSHPEYFRVSFYGVGFPESLRNATMIYRGKPYEKLSDFSAALLSKYPDARLLNTLNEPDENLMAEPDAKYLQMNACMPVIDLKSKFKSASQAGENETTSININDLQESILLYYKHNECDKFQFSRRIEPPKVLSPCPSHDHQSGDDFANMWRQRITLTTNTLPGVLPFFQVFLTETSIISPIECAIDDLERANDRLVSMVNRFRADKHHTQDVRQLGQLLLGIVDAAVNGGITKYEKAFFETNHSIKQEQNNANKNLLTTRTNPSDRTRSPPPLPPPLTPERSLKLALPLANSTVSSLVSNKLDGTNDGANKTTNTFKQFQQHRQSPPQYQPSSSQLEKLKCLIARQVPLLDEAIRLHRERVADVMRPQHDHLEASFRRLKDHVLSKYYRYLDKSDCNRSSGTTRSFRTFARSPNRSTRSESRISLALTTATTLTATPPMTPISNQPIVSSQGGDEAVGGRVCRKRMSDVCSYSSLTRRSSHQRQNMDNNGVELGGDPIKSAGRDDETKSTESKIPYKQLS